jgi:hypothetical protein
MHSLQSGIPLRAGKPAAVAALPDARILVAAGFGSSIALHLNDIERF